MTTPMEAEPSTELWCFEVSCQKLIRVYDRFKEIKIVKPKKFRNFKMTTTSIQGQQATRLFKPKFQTRKNIIHNSRYSEKRLLGFSRSTVLLQILYTERTNEKNKNKMTNQLTFSVADELWYWNTIESGLHLKIFCQHKILNVLNGTAKAQIIVCRICFVGEFPGLEIFNAVSDFWTMCWMDGWISVSVDRCSLTFGLIGLSVGMSVPSALCLLESNVFLFLVADFWQILECFSCKARKEDAQWTTNDITSVSLFYPSCQTAF